MKQEKKNLLFYPFATVGRDMEYALFSNFILLFILYTRQLTTAQLGAVTGIMVAARIFDALNDPIMGNIIERTRGKFGKFKPWLLIGMITTSLIIFLAYNTDLQGWNFVIFFAVIYFGYSITFTMHDIAYWAMIPALSSDGDTRNKITSRATFCAGIGSTLASILIPLFTTGGSALGGNAKSAYGMIALIVAIAAPLFVLPLFLGVKENRIDMDKPAPKVSFKKIISTIGGNDQLIWASVIFLLQQIGNGLVLAGAGTNYIYFEFGYEGGLYSTFTTVGMAASAVLMLIYPMLSRKTSRKKLVRNMGILGLSGYAVMLIAGIVMPSTTIKFWVITIGFMFSNIGQYGLYLIMMISIMNTVEYNELKTGNRDEAIITSMRPFLTKLASSLTVIITFVTYVVANVTQITNLISDLESQANQGVITAEIKSAEIANVIVSVGGGQKIGLLISMTVIPAVLLSVVCILYRRFYKLDEKRFEEICKELESRR